MSDSVGAVKQDEVVDGTEGTGESDLLDGDVYGAELVV